MMLVSCRSFLLCFVTTYRHFTDLQRVFIVPLISSHRARISLDGACDSASSFFFFLFFFFLLCSDNCVLTTDNTGADRGRERRGRAGGRGAGGAA
jgi:hypothetical protein